jgi:hypothetical protein
MNTNIIDLQEASPNFWRAKYEGNYGVYTIKIKTDGVKTEDFSCSCPSDYYPCKHIPMIEKAIKERIAKGQKIDTKYGMTFDELLQNLSQKELYYFISRQAQNNLQLKNAIFLEFSHKIDKKNVNNADNYALLLREELNEIEFDFDDIGYYHDDNSLEIEVLDQWLNKAQEFADTGNVEEALLICKACIEEYASWHKNQDSAIVEYVEINYQEWPFDIINKILSASKIDDKALFDYCKSEMGKQKYNNTEMYENFNRLFLKLSTALGSDDYIALQDSILEKIEDKSSYDAEKILQQKINFYRANNQSEKADDVVKENLQIESFRKRRTKILIAENNLNEAKKLIKEFFTQKNLEHDYDYLDNWQNFLLEIAEKENNIPEIRRIALLFIETRFKDKYYDIYKSTFAENEWPEKLEKLIEHYQKKHNNKWFNRSVADVLRAEKQEERLMEYIEKHLDVNCLAEYYTVFSASFPEKTLALFRQAINRYAQDTGREIYEHIVKLFKKMIEIEGGDKVVREMITQYRVLYKNRKAMMEIINRF